MHFQPLTIYSKFFSSIFPKIVPTIIAFYCPMLFSNVFNEVTVRYAYFVTVGAFSDTHF